jgi:hypothetical protein
MTRDEFIADVVKNQQLSDLPVREGDVTSDMVCRCDCDYRDCKGWVLTSEGFRRLGAILHERLEKRNG